MFSVGGAPPGAGALQARLHDVAVRTFDFARTNRQATGDSVLIIQLMQPMTQVAMAAAHRGIFVREVRRLPMRGECRQHRISTPGFQPLLLLIQPGGTRRRERFDRRGRRSQVLAHVIKIHQILALRTETRLDLRADPARTIAHRMHPTVNAQARLPGAMKQVLSRVINISLQCAAHM